MSKKLSIKQVEHIANLARIGLSDKEKKKLQGDLGSILDYVDKLQEVDVAGVESRRPKGVGTPIEASGPTSHITGLENEMREDDPAHLGPPTKLSLALAELGESGLSRVDPKKLTDMAPDTKGGYIKVKRIL